MIETFAKAAESLEKAIETTSLYDPDMKVEKNSLNTDKTKEGYEPDNHLDKTDFSENKIKEDYNPHAKVEKNTSYEINTRNESLEGDRHPITGVPFERKTVEDADGNEVTGVFPEFESKYDAKLPEDLYQASDKDQFAECNNQLKDSVSKDSKLQKKFTPEQLEQIQNGDTPDGCTWHHNEETGKMQLVDSDVHAKTGHTGGKTIWGGGNENR